MASKSEPFNGEEGNDIPNGKQVKKDHKEHGRSTEASFDHGKASEALGLFHKMRDSDMLPKFVAYCASVEGLCKEGSLQELSCYFIEMKELDIQPHVTVNASLIDGLCKDGYLAEATKIFEDMVQKGMAPAKVAFTSRMNRYLKQGNLKEALVMRDKMVKSGFEPDLHACTSLVWAFCHNGKIEKARNWLTEMINNGVIPDQASYNCMCSKYHKLGSIKEIFECQNKYWKDDEHTVEEDEIHITKEEKREELATLQVEVDLPFEEFLKNYTKEKVSREVILEDVEDLAELWFVGLKALTTRGNEKDMESKLDMLCKKNLYILTVNLVQSQQAYAAATAKVLRRYGDQLYGKQEAILTIVHVESSYVIQKYLDAQRILVKGLASKNHTSLLLNCYTKLKDVENLNKFIRGEDGVKGLAQNLQFGEVHSKFKVANSKRCIKSLGISLS